MAVEKEEGKGGREAGVVKAVKEMEALLEVMKKVESLLVVEMVL